MTINSIKTYITKYITNLYWAYRLYLLILQLYFDVYIKEYWAIFFSDQKVNYDDYNLNKVEQVIEIKNILYGIPLITRYTIQDHNLELLRIYHNGYSIDILHNNIIPVMFRPNFTGRTIDKFSHGIARKYENN